MRLFFGTIIHLFSRYSQYLPLLLSSVFITIVCLIVGCYGWMRGSGREDYCGHAVLHQRIASLTFIINFFIIIITIIINVIIISLIIVFMVTISMYYGFKRKTPTERDAGQ